MKNNVIELVDEVCTNKSDKYENHRLTVYRFMAEHEVDSIIKTHLMNLVATYGSETVKNSVMCFHGIKTKKIKNKKVG